mgnify:FL=1
MTISYKANDFMDNVFGHEAIRVESAGVLLFNGCQFQIRINIVLIAKLDG